jgi:hypothetical protein
VSNLRTLAFSWSSNSSPREFGWKLLGTPDSREQGQPLAHGGGKSYTHVAPRAYTNVRKALRAFISMYSDPYTHGAMYTWGDVYIAWCLKSCLFDGPIIHSMMSSIMVAQWSYLQFSLECSRPNISRVYIYNRMCLVSVVSAQRLQRRALASSPRWPKWQSIRLG